MILMTERLILREFETSDWHAIYEYQRDPAYLRFNPWWRRTEIDAQSFVNMFINWSREVPRRRYQLAIILKEEERLIGNCGLRMKTTYDLIADLGYELDSRYWGHGYATEAAQAMLAFGFEELKLHRIWAYCVEENVASAHVLEKIGMTFEGCQRESEWMKNRWWNTLHYAILDHEWRRKKDRK